MKRGMILYQATHVQWVPTGKGRAQASIAWGRIVMRTPGKTRSAAAELGGALHRLTAPIDTHEKTGVSIVLNYAPKKGKPLTSPPDKPDVDNVAKLVLDVLVDIGVLDDDRRICPLIVEKRYSAENPDTVTIEVARWSV